MDMKNTTMTTCPLCGKKLSRCRIDVRSSILFCKDLKCPYPVGYDCTVFKKIKRQNPVEPNNKIDEFNSGSTTHFVSTSEEDFNVESVANMLIDDITKHCGSISESMDVDDNQSVLNMNHNELGIYFEQNQFDLGMIHQENTTKKEDIKDKGDGQLKEVYDELNDILASLT